MLQHVNAVSVKVVIRMCRYTAVTPSLTGYAQEQWKHVHCEVLYISHARNKPHEKVRKLFY